MIWSQDIRRAARFAKANANRSPWQKSTPTNENMTARAAFYAERYDNGNELWE
jgi:hypothetical protein